MPERNQRQRVERLVSAGGIVYRVTDDKGIETVLCGRTEPPRWSLPKGTPDQGESLEETAHVLQSNANPRLALEALVLALPRVG